MLTGNENKKRFGLIVVIICCLAFVSVSQASWLERDKLLALDGAAYGYFSISVSISGDYVIAGADGDDDNGSKSSSVFQSSLRIFSGILIGYRQLIS